MPFRVNVRDLVVGGLGAGTGAGVGELAGEFVAKTAKQTGWAKFGIKAIVKGILGAVLYGASYIFGGIPGYFIRMMGFGSFGGIAIDLIAAIFPGGIPGIAEKLAVAVAGVGKKAKVAVTLMEKEKVEDKKEYMLKTLGYEW